MKIRYCIKAALVTLVVIFPMSLLAGYSYSGDYGRSYGYPGYGYGSPPDSTDLACLSAIASQNPVLIMEACDLLGADGDGPREQVRMGDPDGEMNEMWCHGDCPTP